MDRLNDRLVGGAQVTRVFLVVLEEGECLLVFGFSHEGEGLVLDLDQVFSGTSVVSYLPAMRLE